MSQEQAPTQQQQQPVNSLTVEAISALFKEMKAHKVRRVEIKNLLEVEFDQFAFVEPQLDAPMLPGNNDYGAV